MAGPCQRTPGSPRSGDRVTAVDYLRRLDSLPPARVFGRIRLVLEDVFHFRSAWSTDSSAGISPHPLLRPFPRTLPKPLRVRQRMPCLSARARRPLPLLVPDDLRDGVASDLDAHALGDLDHDDGVFDALDRSIHPAALRPDRPSERGQQSLVRLTLLLLRPEAMK